MPKWLFNTLGILRKLLIPFSSLFFLFYVLKYFLYSKNFLKKYDFRIPIISIGNIRIGGTGKTPLIDFLLKHFASKYRFAIISKGFKRKTKGLIEVRFDKNVTDVGDEPYLLFSKHSSCVHIVAENRKTAIEALHTHYPRTQYIILDDTFHHQNLVFKKNVLLIDYYNPLYKDFLLPAGNLREPRIAYQRADIILITKCPLNLTIEESQQMAQHFSLLPSQSLFFGALVYQPLKHLFKNEFLVINQNFIQKAILIHGIAQPQYLIDYLAQQFDFVANLDYADHKTYTRVHIQELVNLFHQHPQSIIITTEKDAIKLVEFKPYLLNLPLYVLSIEMSILFNQQDLFFQALEL